MKKLQVGMAAFLVGAISFIAQPAVASTSVAYYSFSNWGPSGSSNIYSNQFSVTNPYRFSTVKLETHNLIH